MKKKRLYISLIIFISLVLFSAAAAECSVFNPLVTLSEMMLTSIEGDEVISAEYRMEKEVSEGFEEQEWEIAYMESLEKKWKEEKKESIKDIEKDSKQSGVESELLEGFEEEELIPNEPITYSGDAGGIGIVLIVDFKTTIVSGSLKYSGDDGYIDAPITEGKINIDNFEIEAKFSGKRGNEYGDFPFVGTINGKISNDLSTFNGEFWDNETGFGGGFTATK